MMRLPTCCSGWSSCENKGNTVLARLPFCKPALQCTTSAQTQLQRPLQPSYACTAPSAPQPQKPSVPANTIALNQEVQHDTIGPPKAQLGRVLSPAPNLAWFQHVVLLMHVPSCVPCSKVG